MKIMIDLPEERTAAMQALEDVRDYIAFGPATLSTEWIARVCKPATPALPPFWERVIMTPPMLWLGFLFGRLSRAQTKIVGDRVFGPRDY